MKIGSKYKFSEVRSQHWEQFAADAGLAKAQAKKRIAVIASSLPLVARQLQCHAAHGFAGHAIVEQIAQLVEQRCALTLRRLATDL